LAADFFVPDFESARRAITDLGRLRRLGARRVVLHRSIENADRVLVTVGVRDRRPLTDYLGSQDLLDWFDAIGIVDLPPVFVGEIVEKLELDSASAHDPPHPTPVVVVADVLRIPDFVSFWRAVVAGRTRFRAYGGIRCWAYRAFDDPAETLLLREIVSETEAGEWLRRHAEERTAWKRGTGVVAPYPPLFVGRLVDSVAVSSDVVAE
jgi:hypothetical protein